MLFLLYYAIPFLRHILYIWKFYVVANGTLNVVFVLCGDRKWYVNSSIFKSLISLLVLF